MEANPVRIIQYFDGTKQGLIPLFQRPYTWDTKHWKVLWEDVLAHYEAESGSTHFMGAVVSFPVETVPVGVSKHLIIDGQQRLTTIAILLCAIRELGEARTKGKIDDYLTNRHEEGADRLKLVPTNDDRKAFHDLVYEDLEATKGHRIRRAYDYFLKVLAGKDSDGEPIDVERVLLTVEKSLQVVMINLGDTDDPYLIFESLNNKGAPLTQADLVRNYVLMRFQHTLASGEQERVYTVFWQPLQDRLGDSLTDFLRHYVRMDGSEVKVKGVYAAMKAKLKQLDNTSQLENELANMLQFAGYYEQFVNPESVADNKVSTELLTLLNLDVTVAFPLLLKIFDAHSNSMIDHSGFVACLNHISSFVVRRSICGVPTNSLNKLFLKWCREFSPTDGADALLRLMSDGTASQRWPTDRELQGAVANDGQYGKKATRQILVAIERSYGHKEIVDLDTATIEHIMPQTLNDEWQETLGQDFESVHTRCKDTLGNLTLTAYNPELGNTAFEEKREHFAKSHIELNRWIGEQEEWNEARILARGNDLAARIVKIWPGPVQS